MPLAYRNRKAKGALLERRLVDDLQEEGFAAERVPYQSGLSNPPDVTVPLCGVYRKVQCKHHKEGFQKTYAALEHADIACVKMNRGEPLIVVRLSTWLEHIKLAESYRAPPISEAAE